MKVRTLILLSVFLNAISAAEMPSLEMLSAESFKERETAQKEIAEWAMANQEEAKKELLKKLVRSTSPEMRVRLTLLIERAYFKPKGYVGIIMMPYGSSLRGIPQQQTAGTGVQITEVLPGTPAAESGLELDDVILKINDWEVKGGLDLSSKVAEQIQQHPPLTPIDLEVRRGKEMIKIKLKLGILPVPSERVREFVTSKRGGLGYVPDTVAADVQEFRSWLEVEIEKERKNLIADRRL